MVVGIVSYGYDRLPFPVEGREPSIAQSSSCHLDRYPFPLGIGSGIKPLYMEGNTVMQAESRYKGFVPITLVATEGEVAVQSLKTLPIA